MGKRELASDDGEDFVCDRCFSDSGLIEFVRSQGIKGICTFCESPGRRDRPRNVCYFDVVSEHVFECLHLEWTEVSRDTMPYDPEEREFVGEIYSTDDIVQDAVETDNFEIVERLVDASEIDDWCPAYGMHDSPGDELRNDWRTFVDFVLKKARFYFGAVRLDPRDEPTRSGAGHFSDIVRDSVKLLIQLNLIRTLPADDIEIFRARTFKNHAPSSITVQEIGPPAYDICSKFSNRMSPAGISMFYGALDSLTAIREIGGKRRGRTAIGSFEPVRDLVLVDLSSLPELPSLFDASRNILRDRIRFLKGFAADLAKPVAKDGREHAEYVPTQIVTEYIRYFAKWNGQPLDGVLYKSSVRKNGVSCVIFADQDACVDIDDIPEEDNEILQLKSIKVMQK